MAAGLHGAIRKNDEYVDYFAVSLRLIGALALILTSCGPAAINADDIWYFASGGVIGSLLSTTLQPLLHSSGGTIALLLYLGRGFNAVYRLVMGQHCRETRRRNPFYSYLCQ